MEFLDFTYSAIIEQKPVFTGSRANVVQVSEHLVPTAGAQQPFLAGRERPITRGTLSRTPVDRTNAAIQNRRVLILYVAPAREKTRGKF